MSRFADAVRNLIATAGSPNGSPQATHHQLGLMLQAAESVGPDEWSAALRQVAPVIASADPTRAGLLTVGCGALVESGADPLAAFDAVLGRLPEVLTAAAEFRDACRAEFDRTANKPRRRGLSWLFGRRKAD